MVKTALSKLDAADLSRCGRTRRIGPPGRVASALLPAWLSDQTFLVHGKTFDLRYSGRRHSAETELECKYSCPIRNR
jgi:hypothetical protein